jgi:hypothetical protein
MEDGGGRQTLHWAEAGGAAPCARTVHGRRLRLHGHAHERRTRRQSGRGEYSQLCWQLRPPVWRAAHRISHACRAGPNLAAPPSPSPQAAIDPQLEDDIAAADSLDEDLSSDSDELFPAAAALLASDTDDEPLSFASLYVDDSDGEAAAEVDPSLLLANCGLSDITVKALEAKGILHMFPIQKMVFSPAMDGADLIARAKTGSGKTLAFALPVVEKILASRDGRKGERGRAPQCIVLAPTRELAKQVEREIASVSPTLMVGCYYGGSPIGPQLRQLRDGVDIVVGTPGRVIDLLNQRALDLTQVSARSSDEMRLDASMRALRGGLHSRCTPSNLLLGWVFMRRRRRRRRPVHVATHPLPLLTPSPPRPPPPPFRFAS